MAAYLAYTMNTHNYTFQLGLGKEHFFRTILLTGMCRVGKTLLGNIISTCANVEYAEEPYVLQMLPIVQQGKNLPSNVLRELWQSCTMELFQDTCILRAANFRPNDLSYIGNKKSAEEIQFRFNKINNLYQAREILSDHLFVINMTEVTFAYEELGAMTYNAPIIYVIRHPYSVAFDVNNKGWLSDNYLHNTDTGIPIKVYTENGKNYIVPFWVKEGKEDFFLSLSTYDRALFYWCSFAEKYLDMQKNAEQSIHTITYEEICKKPYDVYDKLSASFDLKQGTLTENTLGKVYIQNIPSIKINNTELRSLCASITQQLNLGYQL